MTAKKRSPLVPRLRFPEFRDAPGWITRPLRELYDFGPTNTLPRDRLNYNIGTVKNIHYGDIHTRFPALFDITREVVPFVTSADAVDDWDPASFCSEGDMIFADASEDVTDVGKSIEIIALDGQRVVSGTHTIFAKRRGDEPLIGFGGHLFRSEYVRAQIRREAQGTKVYAISPGRLADIDVCLPPFSAEQQKIADCLTSLDDLIAAEGRRLEALRRHKQGLMQQLFPRPGETVPRQRFPEFEGAPDWEQKEIGALARVTQGGTPDTSNANYWCGPINWLTPAEMGKEDSPYIGSTRRTLTEEGLEHCSSELLPPRSVIISTRAPIGHLAINTVPMAINQGCRGLIPVADAHFLYYALLHAKPRLLDFGAGNTFKELSGSALKAFVLPTPSPREQQKIADCLTSLDDLIAAESRKLEALRRHKQGLLQQLFPAPEGGSP